MSTDASLDARRGRQALGLPTWAQGGSFPRGCLSTPEAPRPGKHIKHIQSCTNIAQRSLGRQIAHVLEPDYCTHTPGGERRGPPGHRGFHLESFGLSLSSSFWKGRGEALCLTD